MEQADQDANAADLASADALSIQLLGGFSVSVGARAIEPAAWRLRKAGHLLKLLALAPRHRLHREQALELLWPHLDADAAGNNLRVTLHFARKLLDREQAGGRGAVQARGEQIVLDPNYAVQVDVIRFELAAAAATRSSDPLDYERAIGLYTGDLLPDDRFEDWAAERRESLRAVHRSLLYGLASLREERGEDERAIESLRRALSHEPVDEPAHFALMRLYARTGQRAQALRQYQQLREALQRELDVEPEPETTRLYEAILTGTFDAGHQPTARAASPARRAPAPIQAMPRVPLTNLPEALTSFIGREQEVAALRDTLDGSRLVTLTGPGGSGKTRLALEVSGALLATYRDGVWLVDLTGLADPELVPRMVGVTLNIQEAAGRPVSEVLAEALAGKQMLLVLDNCEHLVAACAELADRLLRACPEVRVLATSREALRVPGEVVVPVPALAVPDPARLAPLDELGEVEAVRLFIERARLHVLSISATVENAAAIATICQRLDGMPLAIELAAARVGSLPVGQIAARLDDALPLLSGGSRTGPARHRSLQATIAWSYDLLSEPERRLFARLAVFASGFTLEAAEAICADETVPPGQVLELLFQLVDKSLIAVEERDGEVRYRLLETIRQYARERLEASTESRELRQHFRDWYRALVERAEPVLLGAGNIVWMQRLRPEIDNMRAVLDSGSREDSLEHVLRVATALWPFWVQSAQLAEGRGWLERLLARGDIDAVPDVLRARAIFAAAVLAQRQGDFAQSMTWTEDALNIWRALGDEMGMALAYNNLCTCSLMRNDYGQTMRVCAESLSRSQAVGFGLGILASLGSLGEAELTQGNLIQAREWLQQSLALARQVNFAPFITWMLASLGEVARHGGDIDAAQACLTESLEVGRAIQDGLGIGRALRGLGLLALQAGNTDEAARLLAESLEAVWALGFKAEIARSFESLAGVAIAQSNPERATTLLAAADALRETIGCPVAPIDRADTQAVAASAHGALGKAVFAQAWDSGRALPLAQAVAEALAFGAN